MRRRPILLCALLPVLFSPVQAEPAAVAVPAAKAPAKPHDFAKWEKAIAAFEKQDAEKPAPKDAVLFVGSSTIVKWKSLASDFAGTTVLNRGFGGNEIADSTHYADRMIFPYHPRMIFLRAGTNDIHAGRSPEEVAEDFREFVTTVRAKLPDVPIAFISVNPSPSRWAEKDKGDRLNALVSDYIRKTPGLVYVDISRISLDAAGKVRPELFVADQLHFNDEGYKLLAAAVKPYLPK
ncbi:MAG: GDSL-type esterase/lipase family protein [Luteolibacter sp.]